ncbi:hypothetical protein SAMN04488570_2676 [Nocardioides scoriae]|uniref:Uncharacterized protein n=1 Tax=Nocardioides scoriae TaxID=642780 RepID=A0A1H1UZE2_9ACTN|nr:hypothetical protein [Nocardioides scoriae]SDS77892.1 hypothetical protein SAMN04488570_2676 [Nocardioides scoriae]
MSDAPADPAPEPRDASEVGPEASRAAWAEAARPVLLEAAGRYRATVTYKQLSTAVQAATGITTARPVAQWIGGVLDVVTQESHARDEPLLSSLCVSIQGSVGEGYAESVERARGVRPEDPDGHAAEERLACYRHWEAVGLPRDGGTPLRTAHFKPARKAPAAKPAAAKRAPARVPGSSAPPRKVAPSKTAAPAPEEKPIRLCPNCFTAVPATGICDYCD